MKVQVRLFGSLGKRSAEYQPFQGLEVEVSRGATVRDLLDLLGLSESQGAVVIAEGRILKEEEIIPDDAALNVMQAVSGG